MRNEVTAIMGGEVLEEGRIQATVKMAREFGMSEEDLIKRLMREFSMDREEAIKICETKCAPT